MLIQEQKSSISKILVHYGIHFANGISSVQTLSEAGQPVNLRSKSDTQALAGQTELI